jgi:hypothetical protein
VSASAGQPEHEPASVPASDGSPGEVEDVFAAGSDEAHPHANTRDTTIETEIFHMSRVID